MNPDEHTIFRSTVQRATTAALRAVCAPTASGPSALHSSQMA